MPLPIALAVAYLAVNVAVMLWIERERAHSRTPTFALSGLAAVLRFGPPLAGVAYLVTISGDWLFFGFVLAFFAASFWLMDGLLAYTGSRTEREPMRGGWDDRRTGAEMKRDRDNAS